MKIALTFNLKEKKENEPADSCSEFDSPETINAITQALENKGHKVEKVDVRQTNIFNYFRKNKVDMVFNIAEGRNCKLRESEVPAILDYLSIPYTGSGTFSLGLALNKAVTKKILLAENIPTPRFQVFNKGNEELDPALRFPLIAKPNCEGSSKGINLLSIAKDKNSLYNQIKEIRKNYKQEVLVEEFIEGREFTVGILENGKTTILPVMEIDFSTCHKSGEYFYSWRLKEYQGNEEMGLVPTFHCPAVLDKEMETKIKEIALRTHRAVGCYDISRTDFRLSRDNVPYVLEINPLPGLNPRESNFPIMAYAAGMKYEDLIEAILSSALERSKLN